MTLALSLPIYAFAAGLLLFGVLVVARFVIDLANEAKKLAEDAKTTSARLSGALEEASIEAGEASRMIERIEQTRAAPRRRGRRSLG